ncbi:MAG: DnaA ATPase domain-containing protein [Atribacterota bacterium]
MDCWMNEICKSSNSDYCNVYCVGYQQLKYLYNSSNMPKKYQGLFDLKLSEVDIGIYRKLKQFKNNILDNINNGRGVFLYSQNKGNGKTSWACILMNEYFKQIALKNNLECRGLFISVPVFLQDLRDDFEKEEKQMNIIKRQLREVDIVIWDDIGTEKPTDWVRETLYSFINYRISNDLSQIYTTNVAPGMLQKNLGERIISRINGQCLTLELRGADKR